MEGNRGALEILNLEPLVSTRNRPRSEIRHLTTYLVLILMHCDIPGRTPLPSEATWAMQHAKQPVPRTMRFSPSMPDPGLPHPPVLHTADARLSIYQCVSGAIHTPVWAHVPMILGIYPLTATRSDSWCGVSIPIPPESQSHTPLDRPRPPRILDGFTPLDRLPHPLDITCARPQLQSFDSNLV